MEVKGTCKPGPSVQPAIFWRTHAYPRTMDRRPIRIPIRASAFFAPKHPPNCTITHTKSTITTIPTTKTSITAGARRPKHPQSYSWVSPKVATTMAVRTSFTLSPVKLWNRSMVRRQLTKWIWPAKLRMGLRYLDNPAHRINISTRNICERSIIKCCSNWIRRQLSPAQQQIGRF